METWFHADRLGTERVFRVNGQATNVLLGYGTYKRLKLGGGQAYDLPND
jgi:hypothetical protein